MTAHQVKLDTLLVITPLAPDVLELLRSQFPRVIHHAAPPFAPYDPAHPIPSEDDYRQADAIFAFTVPNNLKSFEQTPRLKLWQGLSAGYTHLTATDYFKSIPDESEVIFASASGIHVRTIGEHVLGTVLMLTHKLHYLAVTMHNDKRWVPHAELGNNFIRELSELTVGLAGYGHIARETARLFSSCGAKIVALNRTGKPTPETGFTIPHTGDPSGSIPDRYYSTDSRQSTLDFFAACDVVVNTLPDSEATQGFVGRDELKAMKGNALYVNIGRGTTTDQDALVEALEAKAKDGEDEGATGTLRIGGASLDVTTPEPLPSSSPLYTLPNVVLTPHMSGLSKLYFNRCAEVLRQNADRVRSGRGALNAFRGRGEDD